MRTILCLPGHSARKLRALLRKSCPGVGLILFETQIHLNYGPHDLLSPDESSGLCFHAHLPLGLTWTEDLERIEVDPRRACS